MASGPFNGDYGRLFHFITDNPADTGFTIAAALQELCLLSDTLASEKAYRLTRLPFSGVQFTLTLDRFDPRNIFADFPDSHGVFQLSGSHLKAQVKKLFFQLGQLTGKFDITELF
jgi:hypothetical protein